MIIAVVEIEIEHTGSFTGNVVLNFSGTPIADANYLWIKNESGKYDAFRMVNGIATIPQSVADNYLTKTKVFATYVEESSTTTTSGGGGGGGCNAGVVNPLMGLLALPLMWLLKK
jgi:Synergist-CTERM protein sorting domain-containing protein